MAGPRSAVLLEEDPHPMGHLFYSFLWQRRLRVRFRSDYWRQEHILDRTDVIAICAEKYAWPYCYVCQRFHWEDGHRNSSQHRRNLEWINVTPGDEVRRWASNKNQRFPLWHEW